jgi:quercetin dioxygenase-like cupin family protein
MRGIPDRMDMADCFSIVHPDEVSAEQFDTCETAVRKLTEPLGCDEMRVNQVVVEPGEVTTPHSHDGQEEVFVAMTGGQIAIEDAVHDVPAGGIVRVHPDTVRNLLNRTEDATHVWLAFGAPPVGTVDDFGAYVLADDET